MLKLILILHISVVEGFEVHRAFCAGMKKLLESWRELEMMKK